jgi:hypothetical protein
VGIGNLKKLLPRLAGVGATNYRAGLSIQSASVESGGAGQQKSVESGPNMRGEDVASTRTILQSRNLRQGETRSAEHDLTTLRDAEQEQELAATLRSSKTAQLALRPD